MQKIISLFKRDYEGTRLVYDEVVEGAEWVIAGEGEATEKHDGTCCKVEDGKLYKRYDAKKGKTPPEGFIPSQDPDPVTGHWPGWIEVVKGDPASKWHLEAWEPDKHYLTNSTYELLGPKIQGNPYDLDRHYLWKHGCSVLYFKAPKITFEIVKRYLAAYNIEGIVWHHPDGRMVKIKRKDFGFAWPVKEEE